MTYYLLLFYGAVKVATFVFLTQAGVTGAELVGKMWTADDMALLCGVVNYWIMDRTLAKRAAAENVDIPLIAETGGPGGGVSMSEPVRDSAELRNGLFAWQVAEVDYTRFRATGATVVVDNGGPLTDTTWSSAVLMSASRSASRDSSPRSTTSAGRSRRSPPAGRRRRRTPGTF